MKSKVVKNVSVILLCSIVAKLLSYVWEASLAAYLGVSEQADAFYMASGIFLIVYPILDIGIWKVFLPIYKKKIVNNNELLASEVANTACVLFTLLTIGICIIIIFFAKMIVAIIAPGFDDEKKLLTVKYLQLSAPYLIFAATSSVIGAMLQSRECFLGSQLREIGTHAVRLLLIFILFNRVGIYAVFIALIVGSIFRVLIQLPFINWKWKFRISFHLKNEDTITMLKGLPSVAITVAVTQINRLVDKIIGSGVGSGAISCLNYGHKLVSVFSGMISTAIGTATYPTMIQFIAEHDDEKLKRLIENIIGVLVFLLIPISVFCMVFSKELVTVAFQRGAFNASATDLTAGVFLGYCIGMLFDGVTTVVSNVFYGYGDTRTTMRVSIINMLINIGLDLILIRTFGVVGLAVATSVSAALSLIIRLFLLKKYICLDYGHIIKETLKVLIISAISVGISFWVFKKYFDFNIYLNLAGSVIVITVCGILLSQILRVKALSFFSSLIMNRFHRRKNENVSDSI